MWRFIRDKRFDEPARLRHFLAVFSKIEWTDENLVESLNKIFFALNDLIQSDVEYYNKQRYKHRRLSNFTRGGALIFGTIGILAPLLHNLPPELKPDFINNSSAYALGYLSMAIAAAFLTLNRLFGATGGHVRYVMAQLALGRLMTDFRLEWSKWMATNRRDPKVTEPQELEKAFKLFKNVSKDAYQIVQDETKIWSKTITDALEEFEYSIAGSHSHKEGKGTETKPNNSVGPSKKSEGESSD
jgi:hypothetical protein